jgi:hypothetical protein
MGELGHSRLRPAAAALVPILKFVGAVKRNSMLVWTDNALFIAEVGPRVAAGGHAYQSQLAFSGIGSQAEWEDAIDIGGGRPAGGAQRGHRAGVGCDALAATPLIDPTQDATVKYCIEILEMVRAAGYVIVWIDFGKYRAFRNNIYSFYYQLTAAGPSRPENISIRDYF